MATEKMVMDITEYKWTVVDALMHQWAEQGYNVRIERRDNKVFLIGEVEVQ